VAQPHLALNAEKDAADLSGERGELRLEHTALRVQHDVYVCNESGEILSNGFAHTALDPIALNGIAKHPSGGQAHTGSWLSAGRTCDREPGEERSMLLTRALVDPLVVGVTMQSPVARAPVNGRRDPVDGLFLHSR
jgi:hypothetical protein